MARGFWYNAYMINFVIAMDSEAAPVLANMQDVREQKICGKKVYLGTICGEEACVFVCGVGKVDAACGAFLAADRFGAEAIINAGVAGALNQSMQVGAIYAISHACQYDFDLVQLNGTPIGTLNEFEERWIPLATAGDYPLKKLASGDRFNDDRRDFLLLTEDFGADIRDMEGGAIAQACVHAGIPFYSFKAISDVAGSGSTTEQYIKNTALCADNLKHSICGIYADVRADLNKK